MSVTIEEIDLALYRFERALRKTTTVATPS
jgi:hypothetical protein